MLADQGATVTLLEPETASVQKFNLLKRGKHVLKMNLKDLKEREKLMKEVIPKIDVLMESNRPGVMEKLGISP